MKGALFVMLGTLFEVCQGQYIAVNPKPSALSPCDNFSSTALIERFFDLIFTEFHNTPPACICIQICNQQPTYCYPNGCLKRSERKKMEETTFMMNPIQKVIHESTTKSATLGIDHRAIVDDLLERPHLLTLYYGDTTEKPNSNDIIHRPNPFKELILKYKKVPKLEMKYNLREQIKNKKSEKLNKEKNIDISKTRWPSNKHLLHGKSPFHRVRSYKKNGDSKQTKFFVSMYPDNDPLSYSPVYYKKFLAKRENNNGVNVEAIYLYQQANITLESLIDNLIESSLDKSAKDTRLTLNNIEMDKAVNHESTTDTNINFTDLHFLLDEENETNSILNNTAVSIISMNSTKENKDMNKYSHDMNLTNQNMFLEMIASMSKEIEKQNQASMEFLERVAGLKNISNYLTTDMILQYNGTAANLNVTESVVQPTNVTKIINIEPTTENINSNENFTTTKPVHITKSSVYKKTQQRKVHKLKRSKLN